MSSKKTEITFSDDHKCCNKKKKSQNSCSVERRCCTVDYQYHKLTVVSLPADEQTTSDLIIYEYPIFQFSLSSLEKSFKHSDHSPPLLLEDFSIEFRQLLI